MSSAGSCCSPWHVTDHEGDKETSWQEAESNHFVALRPSRRPYDEDGPDEPTKYWNDQSAHQEKADSKQVRPADSGHEQPLP